MEQIPEDSYFFLFWLPTDRFQEVTCFGWTALWDGEQYGNYEEISILSFNGYPNFGAAAKVALDSLSGNIREAFDNRVITWKKDVFSQEQERNLIENALIEHSVGYKYCAKTLKELIDKIINEDRSNCPQFIRDELKQLVI